MRKKLCDEQYSLATDSRKCDCVIKMVEKYFATADEFYDSTSPPEGFMSDLQSCGSA